MPFTLNHLLRELEFHHVDLDAVEFRDALWMVARGFVAGEIRNVPPAAQSNARSGPAQNPPPPAATKLPQSGAPDETGSPQAGHPVHALGDSGSRQMRGSALSLPAAPALCQGVEFDRALRPLRQRRPVSRATELDEEATAVAIAETGIWQVVMVPARGRWLDITLVVETTPTMRLWQDTALEFQQLLWRACAPRSLRTFHLDWLPARRLQLSTSGGRPIALQAPRQFNGVIFVLSDAMGLGWLTADIPELLAQWASKRTTILVQMLPPQMWKRTALSEVAITAINQPRSSAPVRATDDTWPRVTLATLDPASLRRHARMLNGAAGDVVAYRGSRAQFEILDPKTVESPPPFNPKNLSAEDIEKIFRRFEDFASSEARTLARHLAAAPLVLPVMRLIQRMLVADAAPSQLAEIFLSGMIYRCTSDPGRKVSPNQIEYDFLPGLRDRFLNLGGLDCMFKTIELLSRYFEQRLGKGNAFTALLEDPSAAAKEWNIATTPGTHQPLTRVANFLVEKLGFTPGNPAPFAKQAIASAVVAQPQIREVITPKTAPKPEMVTSAAGSDIGTETNSQPIRTVRIFISSTFRDMQAEREHLIRIVFPRLREQLASRRIHLVEVDLRWGISNEMDAIDASRQAVDECRPFFLCLIGARYGWIPQGNRKSTLDDEVHYAVLDRANDQRGYPLFYFRDPAVTASMTETTPGEFRETHGTESEFKLAELKASVINAGITPFIYHAQWDDAAHRLTELNAFGERVGHDLLRAIDAHFAARSPAPVENPLENTAADKHDDVTDSDPPEGAKTPEPLSYYLSVSGYDLRDCREVVQTALMEAHKIVVTIENFVSDSDPPVDVIREKIISCDAVVFIIGGRYGATMPSGEYAHRSYAEMEFDLARQVKKLTHVFMTSHKFQYAEPLTPPLDHLQDRFRKRVMELVHVNDFDSLDSLRRKATRLAILGSKTISSLLRDSEASGKPDAEQSEPRLWAMDELRRIIGLTRAKAAIEDLINQYRLYAARRDEDSTSSLAPPPHLVFAGNPGTGKSTVAKILGKILAEAGVLPEAKFTGLDASDLVSQHVGQTRLKTAAAFEAASGGIIYLDNAYDLIPRNNGDFRHDVLNTIVEWMTHRRQDTIFILAGSPKELHEFLKNNVGLQPRIQWIEFDDFTHEELLAIAREQVGAAGEKLDANCEEALAKVLEHNRADFAARGLPFVNSLAVYRILARAREKMAARVNASGANPSREALITFVAEDIRAVESIMLSPGKRGLSR